MHRLQLDRRGTAQPDVRLERKNVGARLAPCPKYGEGDWLEDWLLRASVRHTDACSGVVQRDAIDFQSMAANAIGFELDDSDAMNSNTSL
jgi:hypothetical protein